MQPQQILAEIERLARTHLDAGERIDARGPLRPDMRLVEELELDSLDLTSLAIEVEDHFRITLDAEEEEHIETLGDLVAAIGRQLDGRDPR